MPRTSKIIQGNNMADKMGKKAAVSHAILQLPLIPAFPYTNIPFLVMKSK